MGVAPLLDLTKSNLRDTSIMFSSSRKEVMMASCPFARKGQRRNLSSMTKCAQRSLSPHSFWIPLVPIAGIVVEICATNDSPLVSAAEDVGGEGLRASLWNGNDLTTRRGRERLYVYCSAKRPRHVWFSLPCRVAGASSQRVYRILQGIADVFPRVQALGC